MTKKNNKEKINTEIGSDNPTQLDFYKEKLQEVQQVLGCTPEEAPMAIFLIQQSKDYKMRNKEYGPAFDLEEIKNVMNETSCGVEDATKILRKLQQRPNLKASIDYSKIWQLMCLNDRGAIEVFDLCVDMIDAHIPKIQYPEIMSFMIKMGCSAKEAKLAIGAREQLSFEYQSYITDDKIKEASEAIGCTLIDAVIALEVLRRNDYPEDYDEIKNTKEEIGQGSSIEDTIIVLIILKNFKESHNIEPLFPLSEIPRVMKEIDGDANEATNLLFILQIKQWPKEINFSFHDLRTMRQFIEDGSKVISVQVKHNLVLNLEVEKQRYMNGIIPQKEWNHTLKGVLKFLTHSQIGQLMKMSWEGKTDLKKMTQVQSVGSSTTTTTTTTTTKNRLTYKAKSPNIPKQKMN